jgi:Uma2 family endonuclease
MSPECAAHWKVKFNAAFALRNLIKQTGLNCHAVPDGATVRISEKTAFEPDALVYCGTEVPEKSLKVPNPAITIEVLSPGTSIRDLRDKLLGYFTLASVHHYLIVGTEARMVIHHARADAGKLMTRIATQGALTLDPPDLELPIAAIFE